MERKVKVTYTGFFTIDESELKGSYEADTFEQAVENQKKWIDDGELPMDEFLQYLDDVNLKIKLQT